MMNALVVFAAILAVAAAECPNYWTKFDQSCYRVRGDTRKWQDAESECIKISPSGRFAQLVSINNQYEQQFVLAFWSETVGHYKNEFWIGANDLQSEGSWQWSDYSPFDYSFWESGEPNNSFGEDCALVKQSNGRWNDKGCGDTRSYVCETAYV